MSRKFETFDVAVVGSGAAGIMAFQRSVLNNDTCILFTGNKKHQKKSRAMWVSKVENMPALFHHKKAIVDSNNEVIDWLNQSPFKENFQIKQNLGVVKIEKKNDIFYLYDDNQDEYQAKYVILCTGVMDVQPMINDSIKPILPFANVQLADYCLRCDGHHVLNKNLSVIGNTTSAMWVAVMLHERYNCKKVDILLNGMTPEFDQESLELAKIYGFQINAEKIISLDGNVKENLLNSIKLENKEIKTDIIFIALGMIVYNDLAKQLGAELDARGFVLTDTKGKSSVDGLYVAGDLRANTKKQIYTSWDTAVDSADDINLLLRRAKRNSLKK